MVYTCCQEIMLTQTPSAPAMTDLTTRAHGDAWYDRLAELQQGYYYPWRSDLGSGDGEEAYLRLLRQHLAPDVDVLDAGCGHGEVALEIASLAGSVLAYDRVASYITMAQVAAGKQGASNVTFLCADSSAKANQGKARIPAGPCSFDLLISRRGPFHWIEDARRTARPGAVLLMLIPEATPVTPWTTQLPESLRWDEPDNPNWARSSIEERLAAGELSLHSWWSFDVPEAFTSSRQLYAWRSFGYAPEEVPPFEEIRSILEQIFSTYGQDGRLTVRHRRHLWKAVVPR